MTFLGKTRSGRTLTGALTVTLGLLVLAAPAAAQFAGGGGGNIILDADNLESAQGVATLTGQVDARQGDVRILADRMVIYSKSGGAASVGAGAGDIERIVATGNFYYITPEQEVRGERGVYMAASDTFEVTGDVILTQEDSVVRGTKLIYELESETARVVSECEGRRCGRDNRVSILIRNTDAVAPGTSTEPATVGQ